MDTVTARGSMAMRHICDASITLNLRSERAGHLYVVNAANLQGVPLGIIMVK